MIKLIVDHYNSRLDMYGNTYWAVVITDVRTNKSIAARTDHSSNVNSMLHQLGYEWDDFHYTEHELPIRQFNAKTKTWPHLHSAEDIVEMFAEERVKLEDMRRERRRYHGR